MEATFTAFAKFGDSKATGKDMDNKKFSKLCKDTGIVGKLVTTTDVDIAFSKHKPKGGRTITFKEFQAILDEFAVKRFPKKEDKSAAMAALVADKAPGLKGTTKVSKAGGTERLTDTSKYTGSHKERFGADGKGKGIEGREDVIEDDGYVVGYQNKDTYDADHDMETA